MAFNRFGAPAPAGGVMTPPHVVQPSLGSQVGSWVDHSAQQMHALNTPAPNGQFPLNPAATSGVTTLPASVTALPPANPTGIPTGGAPAGTVVQPTAPVPTGGAPVPGAPAPTPAVVPPNPSSAPLSQDAEGHHLRYNNAQHWLARMQNWQTTHPERYASHYQMFQNIAARRGFQIPAGMLPPPPAAVAAPPPAV